MGETQKRAVLVPWPSGAMAGVDSPSPNASTTDLIIRKVRLTCFRVRGFLVGAPSEACQRCLSR